MLLSNHSKDFKINLGNAIYSIGVFLLFTPKINLISFEGQTAGIRIDDILIAFIASLVLYIYIERVEKYYSKIELLFFCFTLLGIFSNIVNVIFFKQSNPLYSFRNIEYFVFFYIGHLAKNKISLIRLSYIYILASTAVIALQMIGIIGAFRSEGYFSTTGSRAIGLTGGPWEIGVILMFTLSIILYGDAKYINKISITILTFILLLLTGARLPTLSFFIVVGSWLYSSSKNKLYIICALVVIIPLFSIILSQVDNPVINRSSNLFSYSNIEQFVEYYNTIKIDTVFVDFPDMPIDDTSDMSWLFRVSKWSYAIKYWLNSSIGYIIGLGPGIWGFALDGGWVRILTENGLLGFFIYITFLKQVASINMALKMVIIVLIINMVMIDIHMAYKCMAFFFFILGYMSKKESFKYSIKFK